MIAIANYSVSKEIKKLQRELIRNEIKLSQFEFPGTYQMQNNEERKGEIMRLLSNIGFVCAFTGGCLVGISGGVFIVASLVSSAKIVLWGAIFKGSLYAFTAGLITIVGGGIWSNIDKAAAIKSKIKTRYFHTGENLKVRPLADQSVLSNTY